MSDPFIAEIRIFAGNFAPRGWAFCNGAFLPIAQNTALFSLVGTTYGGDGRTTFGIPNLQGRAPMHPGNGPGLSSRRLGQVGGAETTTLAQTQMPNHSHALQAVNGNATVFTPDTTTGLARSIGGAAYNDEAAGPAPRVALADAALASAGGDNSHNNMQPFLTLNFIISLVGVFPSRN